MTANLFDSLQSSVNPDLVRRYRGLPLNEVDSGLFLAVLRGAIPAIPLMARGKLPEATT